MIHLYEAIVGVKKKPRQIGRHKMIKDLKPGDMMYYITSRGYCINGIISERYGNYEWEGVEFSSAVSKRKLLGEEKMDLIDGGVDREYLVFEQATYRYYYATNEDAQKMLLKKYFNK